VSAGISFCSAIKTNGTLWTWGANGSGQLGDGTVDNRSSPVQIGSLSNWSQVSALNVYCLAIKTDGTLWAWGFNGSGQLGDGTDINKSSPIQIGSLSNWEKANYSPLSRISGALAD
jgi:alpha-tubulin suppressor-like RCC1 family protein